MYNGFESKAMITIQIISRIALLISTCALLIIGFLHMSVTIALYLGISFAVFCFSSKILLHINSMQSEEKPWNWVAFCFSWWLIMAAFIYGFGYIIGYVRLII
jgi:hypothetical protein